MRNRKRPKRKVQPVTGKNPTIDPDNSPDSIPNKKPRWRIGIIDFDGPWGWRNIEKISVIEKIQKRLKQFETMKWHEIENDKNHFIEVRRLSSKARRRLDCINLHNETLFSFRITKQARLWGIRDSEAFNILWWDPKHTVYISRTHKA